MAFDPTVYGDRIALGSGDFNAVLRRLLGNSPRDWLTLALRPDFAAGDEFVLGLREAAGGFIEAGAEILIAPTDRLNLVAIQDRAIGAAADENQVSRLGKTIVEAIGRAVRDAVPRTNICVLAGIGPVDRLLVLEEIMEESLEQAYAAQAAMAAAAGADGFVCRSFVELPALAAAVRGCRRAAGLPVVASMTFDSGPNFARTRMGVTIPEACATLEEAGAVAIGCDGSEFPDGAPAIASLMRESTQLPLWIELNAGRSELREGAIAYTDTPKEFGERLRALGETAVRFVCGGAGVAAEHLSEMRQVREQLARRRKGNDLL